MIGVALTENGTDILETAKRQTWWNMLAAIVTGISVVLQAFSRLCQVYVLGTSHGCIVGRDYQAIATSSPAPFPAKVV